MSQVVKKKKNQIILRICRDKYLLLMLFPVILHYVVFSYLPMYGITLGFKDYSVKAGILGSPWVGFKYMKQFFSSVYLGRLFRNTLEINIISLVIGFPIPILFALALNEIEVGPFKKTIQTISYFPYFISTVIVVALIAFFCHPTNGIFMKVFKLLGYKGKNLLIETWMYRPLFIGSGIWQNFGWNSIIYLSAMTAVDPGVYEAATIDGATRIQRARHITIPGILPTVVMVLIINIGGLFSLGADKVLLLYNDSTREVADVFSTYVFRCGIQNSEFSYATAVGLFNSVCNLILLSITNTIAKMATGISLW